MKQKKLLVILGRSFIKLADVNCRLWHEVEKGYDIENVPVEEKDNLVKMLPFLTWNEINVLMPLTCSYIKWLIKK